MNDDLKYCPFCGDTEPEIVTEEITHGFYDMTLAYVKCTHCCARGSNYMDEDRDEAIEDAIEAWNDPNLRQQTFIMKVKKYIRQWMYDLELKADSYCEKFTNRKK